MYHFAVEIDEFAHQADAYAQLARCYERIGAYKEAVDARERQVSDRSDSFAEARKARELDNMDDDSVDAERFFLGQAWADATYWTGASTRRNGRFGVPLRWTPNRRERARSLGHSCGDRGALHAQEQLQKAMTLANRKIEATPQLGSAHSDLSFVYQAMGNCSEAERAGRRSVELGWSSSGEQRSVVSLAAPRLSRGELKRAERAKDTRLPALSWRGWPTILQLPPC
jgi:tetratricopeptide (TPR) repeat protein